MTPDELSRLLYLANIGKNALYREDEDDFLSKDETWKKLEQEDEDLIDRGWKYLMEV